MKKTELATLEANLKNVFDRREDFVADDVWVVVGEDELMPDGDPIEEYLYGEDESGTPTVAPRDSVPSLEDALASMLADPEATLCASGHP